MLEKRKVAGQLVENPTDIYFFPSTKKLIKANKDQKFCFCGGSGYNYLLDFRDVIEAKGGAGKSKFVSTELIY